MAKLKISGNHLTNVRPVKDDDGFIRTTPTKGHFKMSTLGAERLGVEIGDYVVLTSANDGESYAIAKGVGGEGVDNIGARVGANLTFCSQNAWDKMGGTNEENMKYRIMGFDDNDIEKECVAEVDGRVWYALDAPEALPKG